MAKKVRCDCDGTVSGLGHDQSCEIILQANLAKEQENQKEFLRLRTRLAMAETEIKRARLGVDEIWRRIAKVPMDPDRLKEIRSIVADAKRPE